MASPQTTTPVQDGRRIFWIVWITVTVLAAAIPLIPYVLAIAPRRRFSIFARVPEENILESCAIYALVAQLFALPLAISLAFARRMVSGAHSVEAAALAHCPKCGYDLTGNTSGICSECGWSRAKPGWFVDPRRRWRSGLIFLFVAVGAIGLLRWLILQFLEIM